MRDSRRTVVRDRPAHQHRAGRRPILVLDEGTNRRAGHPRELLRDSPLYNDILGSQLITDTTDPVAVGD